MAEGSSGGCTGGTIIGLITSVQTGLDDCDLAVLMMPGYQGRKSYRRRLDRP